MDADSERGPSLPELHVRRRLHPPVLSLSGLHSAVKMSIPAASAEFKVDTTVLSRL